MHRLISENFNRLLVICVYSSIPIRSKYPNLTPAPASILSPLSLVAPRWLWFLHHSCRLLLSIVFSWWATFNPCKTHSSLHYTSLPRECFDCLLFQPLSFNKVHAAGASLPKGLDNCVRSALQSSHLAHCWRISRISLDLTVGHKSGSSGRIRVTTR